MTGFVPFARDRVPLAVSGELLQYTFGGSEPPGPYTFATVLTQPGTLIIIGNIDARPCSVGTP